MARGGRKVIDAVVECRVDGSGNSIVERVDALRRGEEGVGCCG